MSQPAVHHEAIIRAAERLAESDPGRYDSESGQWDCPHCTGRFEHSPACPWLALAIAVRGELRP